VTGRVGKQLPELRPTAHSELFSVAVRGIPLAHSLIITMASFRAVKKAITLPPTVRTLASGVPTAPLVNLSARAPHDSHSGGHGHDVGPRSDIPSAWAGGLGKSAAGFVSKSYVTRELFSCFRHIPTLAHLKCFHWFVSSTHTVFPTTSHPHHPRCS
jgi:hypothetical protein